MYGRVSRWCIIEGVWRVNGSSKEGAGSVWGEV